MGLWGPSHPKPFYYSMIKPKSSFGQKVVIWLRITGRSKPLGQHLSDTQQTTADLTSVSATATNVLPLSLWIPYNYLWSDRVVLHVQTEDRIISRSDLITLENTSLAHWRLKLLRRTDSQNLRNNTDTKLCVNINWVCAVSGGYPYHLHYFPLAEGIW